jgi:hypothetical protein
MSCRLFWSYGAGFAGNRSGAMTAQQDTYPTVEFLVDKFANWLKHRRDLNEIRQMNDRFQLSRRIYEYRRMIWTG